MSRLLAIAFVFIIAFQAASQGLIYAYYVLNKSYITQNICENKAAPELKCDGKCHLRKMMNVGKKTTTPKQIPLPNLEEIKPLVLFFESITPTSLATYSPNGLSSENWTIGATYLWNYSFLLVTKILDPPQ